MHDGHELVRARLGPDVKEGALDAGDPLNERRLAGAIPQSPHAAQGGIRQEAPVLFTGLAAQGAGRSARLAVVPRALRPSRSTRC